MASDDLNAIGSALDAEERQLRDELRALEEDLHGRLRRHSHANAAAIADAERRVRTVVLRLTAIERERTDLEVARAL